MYCTELVVPAVINRVISTGPVETQLIYILAPEKLAGLSSAWNGYPSLIGAAYKDIPIIGNASSGSFNYEAAIAVEPDIVLEGKTKNIDTDREKFGSIPVVGVDAGADLLTMYEDEITYVADLLGVPERGEKLIMYYRIAMAYVRSVTADLTEAEKVRVYYAQGNDGLMTDAEGSWHTNLLTFCGGANAAQVEVSNTSQAVQVSMEQILAWNEAEPIDMIIIGRTSQASTYNVIMDSDMWQLLQCVQDGNVYVRPDNPTSWFDGPPGYGQILGMYWMVNLLYPERTTSLDLRAKISEFYTNFLHYDLSEAELDALLATPG
jgi:iron complex transport system substrate-binding protein